MTSSAARRYIVAYDIPDDKRRTRLAKCLMSYGDRIQYSVFVVDAKPAKLVRLRQSVREIIDLHDDSVLLCDLGPVTSLGQAVFSFIGKERAVTPTQAIIL